MPPLPNNILIKFSDDSARVRLLSKTCNVNLHFNEIANNIVKWCSENSFFERKKKTKEVVADQPGVDDHSPVYIHDEEIERMSNF